MAKGREAPAEGLTWLRTVLQIQSKPSLACRLSAENMCRDVCRVCVQYMCRDCMCKLCVQRLSVQWLCVQRLGVHCADCVCRVHVQRLHRQTMCAEAACVECVRVLQSSQSW